MNNAHVEQTEDFVNLIKLEDRQVMYKLPRKLQALEYHAELLTVLGNAELMARSRRLKR